MPARVLVLCGPSGSGKSRLACRLGLPILRLDDFYLDGDDPALPIMTLTGGTTLPDWDDPGSWDHAAAVDAIERLCRDGVTEVPDYDIAASRRIGSRPLDLDGHRRFVAEGIFAPEVIAECRRRDMLEDAVCLAQPAIVTFWRRLQRDLREHRKPPWVLLRRGWHLMRQQREIIDGARDRGCRVLSPEAALRELG